MNSESVIGWFLSEITGYDAHVNDVFLWSEHSLVEMREMIHQLSADMSDGSVSVSARTSNL